jgi:hypothetical protein
MLKKLLSIGTLLATAPAMALMECPVGAVAQGSEPPKGYEIACVLADGSRHGPYKHWYSNGQLQEWLHFKNGKEHGLQQVWWPNGQLMMKGESVNGHRYKKFQYWSLSGEPQQLAVEVIEQSVSSAESGF